MPLHVNGLSDNENPMSFGSSMPGLIFDWKSANPSVIKLHTVHANVISMFSVVFILLSSV